MNSPAFDDENIDLEYTAPGHDNALTMPMALVPGCYVGCANCLKLQAENDNLRAERDSLRTQLELETEND